MKYSQQRKQAVIETVGLNESERAEYCRRRGFYPQQVTARPEMTVYKAARAVLSQSVSMVVCAQAMP